MELDVEYVLHCFFIIFGEEGKICKKLWFQLLIFFSILLLLIIVFTTLIIYTIMFSYPTTNLYNGKHYNVTYYNFTEDCLCVSTNILINNKFYTINICCINISNMTSHIINNNITYYNVDQFIYFNYDEIKVYQLLFIILSSICLVLTCCYLCIYPLILCYNKIDFKIIKNSFRKVTQYFIRKYNISYE